MIGNQDGGVVNKPGAEADAMSLGKLLISATKKLAIIASRLRSVAAAGTELAFRKRKSRASRRCSQRCQRDRDDAVSRVIRAIGRGRRRQRS